MVAVRQKEPSPTTTQSSARFHAMSQTDVKESNAPLTSLLPWAFLAQKDKQASQVGAALRGQDAGRAGHLSSQGVSGASPPLALSSRG